MADLVLALDAGAVISTEHRATILRMGEPANRDEVLSHQGIEFFREASVLVLVFGLLDPAVSEHAGLSLWGRISNIKPDWLIFILVLSYFTAHLAYVIEVRLRFPDPKEDE